MAVLQGVGDEIAEMGVKMAKEQEKAMGFPPEHFQLDRAFVVAAPG